MDEIEGLAVTPRLQRALQAAVEDARVRGHGYLGTEHVLVGLLSEPDGIAARVLEQLGVAAAARDGVDRILGGLSYHRPDIADPELRQELLRRREVDQAPRRQMAPGTPVREDLIAEMQRIDRENAEWLRAVIRDRGWPGRSLVGNDGSDAAWLIVQHAGDDPAFQRECLELLDSAVAQGEASPRNLAYLTDRVLLHEHGRQRYGTQFTTGPDGPEPFPLEDPERVDELRAGMGLQPLAEYAKAFPKVPGTTPSSDPWVARLDRELAWWRTFLQERAPDDPEFQERFDPDRPLPPHLAGLLPADRPAEQVRVLDCAAGPATALGRGWRGGRVQLVAIDALAGPYRQLLDRLDLRPPVPTTSGLVEQLDRMFAEASFDLVYMRNALDHCRDPRLALEQMLRVARPGGAVVVEHYNHDPRPLVPEHLPGASIEADYSDGRMTVVIRRK